MFSLIVCKIPVNQTGSEVSGVFQECVRLRVGHTHLCACAEQLTPDSERDHLPPSDSASLLPSPRPDQLILDFITSEVYLTQWHFMKFYVGLRLKGNYGAS